MRLEYHFTCPLESGLHARPATQLARCAGRYAVRVQLLNERSGARADCSSVLSLVSAAVQQGDRCTLFFEGSEAGAARAAVAEFVERELPHCDDDLAPAPPARSGRLPRALAGSGVAWQPGVALSPGIGRGRVVQLGGRQLSAELQLPPAGSVLDEQRRADAAVDALAAELNGQAAVAQHPVEQGIIAATLAILLDPELRTAIAARIAAGEQAEIAAREASLQFSARLEASESEYLRERRRDIEDIGLRLIAQLQGIELAEAAVELSAPAVICAASLSPAQLLGLERRLLRAVVLAEASPASHGAILARALGIPVLGGVEQYAALPPGAEAVVDAGAGVVIAPLSPAAFRYYELEAAAGAARDARLASVAAQPARTRDGRRVETAANISTAAEAAAALEQHAEGIGLFRTEMLYTARAGAPSEDEQYRIYADVIGVMAGRPVIIRSFDAGGDKPLPYLQLAREANPFLGCRGVRLYDAHPRLLDAQLRAVCRASALGPVRLMAPMVATVDEARRFHHRVIDVQLQLKAEGAAFDERMPIGVMLEVPSAVFAVAQLAGVCDFFSIGSNDLCQYFFAADRGNPQVAGLNSERHPAFLRLLKLAADEARLHGRWIGLCGEMARDPRLAPLLVGLGFDELSLAAPGIPALKAALARLDSHACRALLEQAVACSSEAEVDAQLDSFAAGRPVQPLLAPGLLAFDVDCADKAQVLRALARLMYAQGRTDEPDVLEDALWAREEQFSTGLGHGIAVPHCKSRAATGSLAVLKLRQPVAWSSLDGAPVDVAIMLAVPEGAQREHLQVFARLARRLMDEGFRAALRNAGDAPALLALLETELELAG